MFLSSAARVMPTLPKQDRPAREGARVASVETGLAAAAAKLAQQVSLRTAAMFRFPTKMTSRAFSLHSRNISCVLPPCREGAAETSQTEVHQKATSSASCGHFPAHSTGAHATLAATCRRVCRRPESRQEDGLLLCKSLGP